MLFNNMKNPLLLKTKFQIKYKKIKIYSKYNFRIVKQVNLHNLLTMLIN